PQDYGRNHADGANMLAHALGRHDGIVMWRAFVYKAGSGDRFKQAYEDFKPLDGQFAPKVLVQVKNGPIDFQAREPFHPLFGAMPKTPLVLEVQLTQEYLGMATHLVYLAPLIKECLDADTQEKGPGSTVAKVVDGSLEQHRLSGIAGVANIGSDRNWTGHPVGQANWYAFGRLAWDYTLTSAGIDDPTMAHIHAGAAGVNGPVTVGLPDLDAGEHCQDIDKERADQITAKPGDFYVNIHNGDFPGGAIRGQLTKKD
ncbi:MAG: CHRD domain-containing protein, partial [Deltaproteobacteria bacterium]